MGIVKHIASILGKVSVNNANVTVTSSTDGTGLCPIIFWHIGSSFDRLITFCKIEDI